MHQVIMGWGADLGCVWARCSVLHEGSNDESNWKHMEILFFSLELILDNGPTITVVGFYIFPEWVKLVWYTMCILVIAYQ